MDRVKHAKQPNVLVLGGGTGSFVVLSGLREKPINLTSLISMMDSGGSTGRLRDQLGVLPPGDLRQALVALSSSPQIWRDLFVYRFENGDFHGHNFGNIFISALEKITGSIEEAVSLAGEVLRIKGEVLPVTTDNSQLCVRLEDDTIIEGEAYIDMEETERPRIRKAFLNPSAFISHSAQEAIKKANFIVIGPGDLYTSIIPNLLVHGVPQALKESKAKVIYIANLMTKVGQTDNFKISDHLNELQKYMGEKKLNYTLINNAKPKGEALKWYENALVSIVEDDIGDGKDFGLKVIRGDFMSTVTYQKSKSDKVKRSLIRHDSEKLAKSLMRLFVR